MLKEKEAGKLSIKKSSANITSPLKLDYEEKVDKHMSAKSQIDSIKALKSCFNHIN